MVVVTVERDDRENDVVCLPSRTFHIRHLSGNGSGRGSCRTATMPKVVSRLRGHHPGLWDAGCHLAFSSVMEGVPAQILVV